MDAYYEQLLALDSFGRQLEAMKVRYTIMYTDTKDNNMNSDEIQNELEAERHYKVACSYLEEEKYDAGIRRLNKAVEYGSALACCHLGDIYYQGTIIKRDWDKAFCLYLLAAKKKLPVGISNVGYAFTYGIGVERNEIEGSRWYELAANLGDGNAQVNMGFRCLLGAHGIERDDKLAAKYLACAAKQDIAQAQIIVGLMLYYGIGYPVDRLTALIFLQDGITKQASRLAYYHIGISYYTGEGLYPAIKHPDFSKAYRYITYAAQCGVPDAIEFLLKHENHFDKRETLLVDSILTARGIDVQYKNTAEEYNEKGINYYECIAAIANDILNWTERNVSKQCAEKVNVYEIAKKYAKGRTEPSIKNMEEIIMEFWKKWVFSSQQETEENQQCIKPVEVKTALVQDPLSLVLSLGNANGLKPMNNLPRLGEFDICFGSIKEGKVRITASTGKNINTKNNVKYQAILSKYNCDTNVAYAGPRLFELLGINPGDTVTIEVI